MKNLIYGSIMAASGIKLGYDYISAVKWKPDGRRQVRETESEELENMYMETEEYFQQLEQRKYELCQKLGHSGAAWAHIETILSNPIEHAKKKGRKEAIDKKKEHYERMNSTR